jgi:membrane protease YdiL (CAAX protease family)
MGKNPAIWENSYFLEIMEVSLGVSLAIFLSWVETNFPSFAASAHMFNILLIWSAIFYVGKKFVTLQTVGLGKNNDNALLAGGAGLVVGFLFASNFSLLNMAIPSVATFAGISAITLFVGIVAPLTEETFFRGSLMPTIAEWSQHLKVGSELYLHIAVLGSAALFGLFHFAVSNGNMAFMFSAFVFGAGVGYGSVFFKSTAFAYIAHLYVNLHYLKVV